jgi:acetyltransferase-like isoleucine patch superfamily enzyme
MNDFIRRARFDGLLYLCNHIVAEIPSHTLRLSFYRHVMGFEIGKRSFIFMGASFDCGGGFHLGNHSVINERCRLDNRGTLRIGNNVSVSSEVCILTADHDPQSESFAGRNRVVEIEDYVFIGTRALILPGCRIGRGAIVAAGSIVTRNVEPSAIVAGNPAKTIGQRPQNLSYELNYARLFA